MSIGGTRFPDFPSQIPKTKALAFNEQSKTSSNLLDLISTDVIPMGTYTGEVTGKGQKTIIVAIRGEKKMPVTITRTEDFIKIASDLGVTLIKRQGDKIHYNQDGIVKVDFEGVIEKQESKTIIKSDSGDKEIYIQILPNGDIKFTKKGIRDRTSDGAVINEYIFHHATLKKL
ncbi:MAG: hypothetical protein HYU63_02800 [Armatimonadetes bacterium]|nr:hypothetical protein [Armatimonadota bacterium]